MVRTHALLRLAARPAYFRQHNLDRQTIFARSRRKFTVLGIETSADDTCVALMRFQESPNGRDLAHMILNDKVTYANQKHRGIHPVEAVASHTQNLSRMVSSAVLPEATRKPDLICVTRGPGMGGCLSVGVSTAKALSDAWDVPIVGVHHMQAHALTPFMESALRYGEVPQAISYPVLTLLVSGKHTMLVHTKSPVDHSILASTHNSALGDVLDKVARELVLLPKTTTHTGAICYPLVLERMTRPLFQDYSAPETRRDEIEIYQSEYGWRLQPPLRESKEMRYDFTGLGIKTLDILRERPEMSEPERRVLAVQFMRLAFEHLMSRVIIALETNEDLLREPPKTLVLSGGVASNWSLRDVVTKTLKARGFGSIKLRVPRPQNCTDNAGMIAYAGYEMYKSGWQTDKAFCPKAKWSIEDILSGVDCWTRRPGFPNITPEDAQSKRHGSSPDDNEASTALPGADLFFPGEQTPSRPYTTSDGTIELPEEELDVADPPLTTLEETDTDDETLDSAGEEIKAANLSSDFSHDTAVDGTFETPGEEKDEFDLQLEQILRQAESILDGWDSGSHGTHTAETLQAAPGLGNARTQADHDTVPKRKAATPPPAEPDKPPSPKSSPSGGQDAGNVVAAKANGRHRSPKEKRPEEEPSAPPVKNDAAPSRQSPSTRDQAPPPPHCARDTDATASTATVKESAHDGDAQPVPATSASVHPASDRATRPVEPPQATTTTPADACRDHPRQAKLADIDASKPATETHVATGQGPFIPRLISTPAPPPPPARAPVQVREKPVLRPRASKVWPIHPTGQERHALKVHYVGFEEEPAPQRSTRSFMSRIASTFGWGRKG